MLLADFILLGLSYFYWLVFFWKRKLGGLGILQVWGIFSYGLGMPMKPLGTLPSFFVFSNGYLGVLGVFALSNDR